MGLGDYLWPFERKFSEIPCAREAGIAAMAGGVGLGASSILITNQTKYAYKTSIYSGFALFWITFLACRFQHNRVKKLSEQFVEAYKSGDID